MGRYTFKGKLSRKERKALRSTISAGVHSSRHILRCQVLLLSDEGKSVKEIQSLTGKSSRNIIQLRRLWREGGVERAISENPRSGRPRKHSGRDDAKIVALACTDPPAGQARWSVRLLTKELGARDMLSQTLGRDAVHVVLKSQKIKPWKKRNSGASPS